MDSETSYGQVLSVTPAPVNEAHASPGQQATALLSILLLEDGPPPKIDQPEDDLNNEDHQ